MNGLRLQSGVHRELHLQQRPPYCSIAGFERTLAGRRGKLAWNVLTPAAYLLLPPNHQRHRGNLNSRDRFSNSSEKFRLPNFRDSPTHWAGLAFSFTIWSSSGAGDGMRACIREAEENGVCGTARCFPHSRVGGAPLTLTWTAEPASLPSGGWTVLSHRHTHKTWSCRVSLFVEFCRTKRLTKWAGWVQRGRFLWVWRKPHSFAFVWSRKNPWRELVRERSWLDADVRGIVPCQI